MSIVAWRASREERRQSANSNPAEAPSLFATAARGPVEPRLGLALALGAFIIATAAAGALVFSHGSQRPTAAVRGKAAPRADQRDQAPGGATHASAPLELVALDHERDGETLTVRGVIRNPASGAEMHHLTAVVSVFDRNGGYLASGRAAVDSLSLVPGGQSAFAVSIFGSDVGRYRVSFQADDQPVWHLDKRPPPPVPVIGTNQDGHPRQAEAVGRAALPKAPAAASPPATTRSPECCPQPETVLGAHAPAVPVSSDSQTQPLPGSQAQAPSNTLPQGAQGSQGSQVFTGSPASQDPQVSQGAQASGEAFRFKSGIELINVTATVTDASGHFVPGLRQEDFEVFEDDERQSVTQFSADRVPVSLGILLDTSQSMRGDKFEAARAALDRFLNDLTSPDDEFFLTRFSTTPALLQGWTNERSRIGRALAGIVPRGDTAMYDAIVDALPLTHQARNLKKALVIISDGNDNASNKSMRDVQKIIRENEALMYAVGIDCAGRSAFKHTPPLMQRGPFPPFPFPMPPGGRGGWPPSRPPGQNDYNRCTDPVDTRALRALTDDSGGRTEIVKDPRDLNPATTGIADELSKQYYLGYPSAGKKDGRWHAIRVEVRNKAYRVRARRGYVAS